MNFQEIDRIRSREFLHDPTIIPHPLATIDTVRIRQQLAGLVDSSATKPPEFHQACRSLAVEFCACLPMIFGSELKRETLWDRIGSAIQTAYAKSQGADVDMFIQHVCDHIKAGHSATLACAQFCAVLDSINAMTSEEAREWMTYMNSHLVPVLAKAKRAWNEHKDRAKEKSALRRELSAAETNGEIVEVSFHGYEG